MAAGVRAEVDTRDLIHLAAKVTAAAIVANRIAAATAAHGLALRVRGTIPHRTGRLAASITVNTTDSGATFTMGNSDTPYARWVEYGSKGSTARPYKRLGRYVGPAKRGIQPIYEGAANAAMSRETAKI